MHKIEVKHGKNSSGSAASNKNKGLQVDRTKAPRLNTRQKRKGKTT